MSTSWDYFDLKEEMARCLAEWDASDDYLFDDDIFLAGRFAVIPVVAESSLGGSGVVHFNSFVRSTSRRSTSTETSGEPGSDVLQPGRRSTRKRGMVSTRGRTAIRLWALKSEHRPRRSDRPRLRHALARELRTRSPTRARRIVDLPSTPDPVATGVAPTVVVVIG